MTMSKSLQIGVPHGGCVSGFIDETNQGVVMDYDEFNSSLYDGESWDVDTARRTFMKLYEQDVTDAIREVIAEDIDAELPEKGKQFVHKGGVPHRIAVSRRPDNTTEKRAHDRLG